VSAPETEREAAEELPRRGYLWMLVAEVEAKHGEIDVDAIAWGPWLPCPTWGSSSWQAEGLLATTTDTLAVSLVASEDHEPVVTSHWRSNGREPAAWTLDDLREVALEHADTAPKGHHPGAEDLAQTVWPEAHHPAHGRTYSTEPDMHAANPIDATIAPEIRTHVRKLEELWALLEAPPDGVDVAANVAAYVAESGEDVVLAIALYLKASLEPALDVGRKERGRILEAVQANEREREWLRGVLVQLLDRLGKDKIKGPTITVRRTAGGKAARMRAGADVDLLPERFVVREPRLGAIREALLAGEDVPGFYLAEGEGVSIR
jgi:Siphovirus Gp157